MATTWTNKHHIPDALARAVALDDKAKVAHYSVTELLSPPLMRRLLAEKDVSQDVSERIWALLGKGCHAVLDKNGDETERCLIASLDGVSISGTLDEITQDTIRDWKVTSVWSWIFGGRLEWEQQLNCYRWLAVHAHQEWTPGGVPILWEPRAISSLQVTMIFRDWMQSHVGRDNYPDAMVKTIDIDIWDEDKTVAFLRERLAAHLAPEPRACSDEERWHRPGAWAVMRLGRKTALRTLATEAAARVWAEESNLPGLKLEHRPGKDVRCLSYCPARSVCSHALSLTNTDDQQET